MKILVTGGSGFIGSNFIHQMLHTHPSYQIINLDKLTYAGNESTNKALHGHANYTFVCGDILDTVLVDALVKEVDAIVHFAAESHVDNSIKNSGEFIRTNILGTHVLLEAARRNGNKRFHHVSTDEVFGHLHPDEPPFHEETRFAPRSPYSASKASSDHLVQAYFHTYGLPITMSNCSNNYGPYQFPEKLIPLFVTNLILGKKVPLYGDGLNVRDWIHVHDHNRAVDLILHTGRMGETYCIGSESECTNRHITDTILKLMGKDESWIEYVEDRKGHDRRYAIHPRKIRTELGWDPLVTFEQGIADTVRWYQENQDWWEPILSGVYKEANAKYAQGA